MDALKHQAVRAYTAGMSFSKSISICQATALCTGSNTMPFTIADAFEQDDFQLWQCWNGQLSQFLSQVGPGVQDILNQHGT